jgi:RHS repeat-associated protein
VRRAVANGSRTRRSTPLPPPRGGGGALNGTTRFLWGGDGEWQCLEERDGSDSLVARFTYSPGYIDAVAVQERDLNADSDFGDTNEVVYYQQNTLFSVYALSDSSGSVIERYRYDAYGGCTVLDADGSADADGLSDVKNPYTFTARRLDLETGLMQYRNRYYAPALGRFVCRDPANSARDLDLYAYTGNRPIAALDPRGLTRTPPSLHPDYDEVIGGFLLVRHFKPLPLPPPMGGAVYVRYEYDLNKLGKDGRCLPGTKHGCMEGFAEWRPDGSGGRSAKWTLTDPLGLGDLPDSGIGVPYSGQREYDYGEPGPYGYHDWLPAPAGRCSLREEAFRQIMAVGPTAALVARWLAHKARVAAGQSGLSGPGNGDQDAFRHCYWSCRMTQELGAEIARLIGQVHEVCGAGPPVENEMDMHNNEIGIGLGADAQTDCKAACMDALGAGQLFIIVGGVTMPSPTPSQGGKLVPLPGPQ